MKPLGLFFGRETEMDWPRLFPTPAAGELKPGTTTAWIPICMFHRPGITPVDVDMGVDRT